MTYQEISTAFSEAEQCIKIGQRLAGAAIEKFGSGNLRNLYMAGAIGGYHLQQLKKELKQFDNRTCEWK